MEDVPHSNHVYVRQVLLEKVSRLEMHSIAHTVGFGILVENRPYLSQVEPDSF